MVSRNLSWSFILSLLWHLGVGIGLFYLATFDSPFDAQLSLKSAQALAPKIDRDNYVSVSLLSPMEAATDPKRGERRNVAVSLQSPPAVAKIRESQTPAKTPTNRQKQHNASSTKPEASTNQINLAKPSSAVDAKLDTTASLGATPDTNSVLSEYERELLRRLHIQKRYPEIARRLRQQGRVQVIFELERSGRVMRAEIVEPTIHSALNQAAKGLIESVGEFKPFPKEIKETRWVFRIPIEYRL